MFLFGCCNPDRVWPDSRRGTRPPVGTPAPLLRPTISRAFSIPFALSMNASLAAAVSTRRDAAIGVSFERNSARVVGRGAAGTSARTRRPTATLIVRARRQGAALWTSRRRTRFWATIDPGYKAVPSSSLVHRAARGLAAGRLGPDVTTPLTRARRDIKASDLLATPPAHPAGRYVYSKLRRMIAGTMSKTSAGKASRAEVFDPLARGVWFGPGYRGSEDQPLCTGWERKSLP